MSEDPGHLRPTEDPTVAPPVEPLEETSPPGDRALPDQPMADGRPPSQVEAEEGARDEEPAADPRARAADIASARQYADAGIAGAPGSEADPGGDLPEPYPYEGARTPSQAEAEGAEPQQVPRVEGAPGAEPGTDGGMQQEPVQGTAEEHGQAAP